MTSVIAICIGACVGALSRWQLGLWLNPATNANALTASNYPWGTLLANLVGGYLVGLCIAVFQGLPDLDPVWRLALITGFLGDLVSIAEVVRDLFRAEDQPEQSYSERQIFEAACSRLARELAAMEQVDEPTAVQKLIEILKKAAEIYNKSSVPVDA